MRKPITSDASIPSRGGETVTTFALEVRDWLDDEESAGRDAGEDAAWAMITSRWGGIGTETAERVLHAALALGRDHAQTGDKGLGR